FFLFSSRRRHTRWPRAWSSDVCSSDLDDTGQIHVGRDAIRMAQLDPALHLTRDELERLATPMLRRAVYATADVIARCQLAPHQRAEERRVGKEWIARGAPHE